MHNGGGEVVDYNYRRGDIISWQITKNVKDIKVMIIKIQELDFSEDIIEQSSLEVTLKKVCIIVKDLVAYID